MQCLGRYLERYYLKWLVQNIEYEKFSIKCSKCDDDDESGQGFNYNSKVLINTKQYFLLNLKSVLKLFYTFMCFSKLYPYPDFTSTESLTIGLSSLQKEGTLEKGINRAKNRTESLYLLHYWHRWLLLKPYHIEVSLLHFKVRSHKSLSSASNVPILRLSQYHSSGRKGPWVIVKGGGYDVQFTLMKVGFQSGSGVTPCGEAVKQPGMRHAYN